MIEDAARSFGAAHTGRKSCNISMIGCTSLFRSKPLGCCGDGGAVFTSDPDLAKVIRQIARHGEEKRCHHICLGGNSRLDTLQAAVLLPKLAILDDEIASSPRPAEAYDSALAPLGLLTPRVAEGCQSAWAQYIVRVPNREVVQAALHEAGTPMVVHYPVPLNRQPDVAEMTANLTEAAHTTSEVLSLPIHPYMCAVDQALVAAAPAGTSCLA